MSKKDGELVANVKMADAEAVVGKFLVLWRNESKQPCKVLDVDKAKQEIRYELQTGPDKGKRFKSRYDASQTVKVYSDAAAVLAMLDA